MAGIVFAVRKWQALAIAPPYKGDLRKAVNMGRPTSNPKTETLRVRINSEMSERIAELGGNKSDVARELLRKGLDGTESFVPQKAESFVPQNEYEELLDGFPLEDLNDMSIMAVLSGGSLVGLLKDLHDKLDRSVIILKDGKIDMDESESPLDLSKFLEACSERDKDPQKMLNMATQSVWRS